jgi:phage N-6-adenine-methyltransferase
MSALIGFEETQLKEYETVIERGLNTFMDVGEALMAIRDQQLYRNHFSTFSEYCQTRWGLTRAYGDRLIAAAETVRRLTPIGVIPANESQARPLTKLEPEEQPEVWQRAVDTAPDGNITARHVQQVVAEHIEEKNGGNGNKPHVTNNSGEVEWYTPPEFLEAARRTMGSIELDPASCELANLNVQAETYYTKENDGLNLSWFGRVWLNPPYSQPEIAQFADKMVESVVDGDIEQACMLINNATDTAWFHKLLTVADAICLIKGRVRFIDRNGDASGSCPLQGQVVLYFGDKRASFDQWFSPFGPVLYGRH